MNDWDDLQHFLAVAETGSTLAAGRSLRVSQTTSARRIATLEAALGLRLFDRRQAGYQLTADGEALVAQARSARAAIETFADAAAARARANAGSVRLTTSDIFAATILTVMLRDFHHAHPDIRVELDTSDAMRDLDAGAADIALRVAESPTGNGLVGRRVADHDWTLYCSRDYAAQHGVPRTIAEVARHPLIGGGGGRVWEEYRAWLQACNLEQAVAIHHGTSLGLLAAVRSGFGLGVLPCIVADCDPDFVQCLPTPKMKQGIWLLSHERVRHEPRVRITLDFLFERFMRLPRPTYIAA